MPELYKVCFINKHDTGLESDEMAVSKWVVMSKEQLEKYIQKPLNEEDTNGRVFIGYSEIVWKKSVQ